MKSAYFKEKILKVVKLLQEDFKMKQSKKCQKLVKYNHNKLVWKINIPTMENKGKK